jgi:predicted amidohydrolase
MNKLKIAAAQICVTNDIEANEQTINRAVDFAIAQRADILLTPEGSLSGYHSHFDVIQVKDALSRVTCRAKKGGIGLALGTCYYEDDDLCYNQLRFYDKHGCYLNFHSKTLTCGSLQKPYQGEINDYSVKPLEVINFEGITIGGLICNDMWGNPECTPQPDPHLSQRLSDMGAKIIFHAVNGGRDESEYSQVVARNYHESNLRMRARAGNLWIVTADNAYPADKPNSCTSGVIAPDGSRAYQAPRIGEHCFTFSIDIQ